MQELRFVAVSEDGSYAVLAVPGRSGRYILPIDERLRAVAMGQTSRLAQYEIEVESPLRPKEIQARIRAGETAEEIADAAGIPVERVRWFEGPVLAERAYIADQAQAASVRRAGDSGGPGPRLGDIVPERLTASGAAIEDGQWDSRKRGDGNWQVTLTFPSGGRLHVAEWVFDSRRRHVMPDDDNAARLSLPESELPTEPVSLPGEATVTPLAPRLGAAAGMGGGGFAGGGSGVGVRSFRPERSVIPDRSLGGDRSLADRPVAPERPAMSHGPTVPPVPPASPRPAHHDHTAFRDVAPELAAHRDPVPAAAPAPEPPAYRAAAPELRAPEQPVPAGTVPVTAPPYVFEDRPSPALASSPAGDRAGDRVADRVGDRVGDTPARRVVFEDAEPAYRDEQFELAPPPAASHAPMSASPTPPAPTAPTQAAGISRAQQPAPPAAPAAPAAEAPGLRATAASAATALPAESPFRAESAAQAGSVAGTESTVAATTPSTSAPTAASPAPASPAPAPVPAPPQPATGAGPSVVAPVEPASAPTAAPVTVESPAASATTTPAPPEPAAASAAAQPEPAAESQPAAAPPAQAESAQAESAEDQAARQRPGGKKSAKGRRSSVPSWDEIMLGSSRQRD